VPAPLKEAYEKCAPDPKHWPVLFAKVNKLLVNFSGFRPEDMRSIDAPIMVMTGDRDFVRPEHAVEMFRLLPRAELAILPGAGHIAIVERPEWIFSMITTFLKETQ